MSDDQLHSIVQRIQRHESISSCRASLQDTDARHKYALRPLLPFIGRHSPPVVRAGVAAARILGVKSDVVWHRAKMWRRRGTFDAVSEWVERLNGHMWEVPELPADCVGYIYVAKAVDYPGIYKVGFSQTPDARLKALQYQHKIRLDLVSATVGTCLDEHLSHIWLSHLALANEWFDVSGEWRKALPGTRFLQPETMWRKLTSDFPMPSGAEAGSAVRAGAPITEETA